MPMTLQGFINLLFMKNEITQYWDISSKISNTKISKIFYYDSDVCWDDKPAFSICLEYGNECEDKYASFQTDAEGALRLRNALNRFLNSL